MKISKIIALAMACVVAILGLAGCKDDKMTMATAAAFAPFEYREGEEFKGIDIDIARIIASELKKELVIQDMEFDSVVQAVASGNADVAISGLTVNETRKKVIDFSDTYFTASQMVITRANDTRFKNLSTKEAVENAINANKGLKIGVQAGTTGEFYAKGDKDWGFSGFKDSSVVSFKDGAMAVSAMMNGQIDIVIIDEMPAKALIKSNAGSKLIEISLTDESYAIGVNKGQSELLGQINEIIAKMKGDGRMNEILERYYSK